MMETLIKIPGIILVMHITQMSHLVGKSFQSTRKSFISLN